MIEETDLSERQREVVHCTDDLVLVLGGAGCGKTTTALWAARHELARRNEVWARVGFLTFSRTAVDQIASRSRSALVSSGDRIEISTFHGFAYRLVKSFARYAGFGSSVADLQSPAEVRLHGRRSNLLSYDDLLPRALQVLQSTRVRELLAARWPLVICDEFQDTSDEQWQLLDILRQNSRLLLLADSNQMIYSFLPGVGPQRLRSAAALADSVIELESVSRRDPSGGIPALAEAALRREFNGPAAHDARRNGRLTVRRSVNDDDLIAVISEELKRAWAAGDRDFGIFGHSNEGVASLGYELTEAGIDHVLIGLTDAQGEALAAMAAMCAFAAGLKNAADLRVALATFLTACSRGKRAPELAVALASGHRIPPTVEQRMESLEAALSEAYPDAEAVCIVIAESWESLGILAGVRPWTRAVPVFAPVVRRAARRGVVGADAISMIEREVRVMRTGALLDSSRARTAPTQLMNFHQTKGREADAVLLVYRDGDVLAGWNDSEPFEASSRVLYVALTRARRRVSVILPPNPHPLVAPFAALA